MAIVHISGLGQLVFHRRFFSKHINPAFNLKDRYLAAHRDVNFNDVAKSILNTLLEKMASKGKYQSLEFRQYFTDLVRLREFRANFKELAQEERHHGAIRQLFNDSHFINSLLIPDGIAPLLPTSLLHQIPEKQFNSLQFSLSASGFSRVLVSNVRLLSDVQSQELPSTVVLFSN